MMCRVGGWCGSEYVFEDARAIVWGVDIRCTSEYCPKRRFKGDGNSES